MMLKKMYASEFQDWLTERLNECSRAGIEDGDIADQITTDFIEAYPFGVVLTEDSQIGG